ncbi:MAG TPA: glycerophosphoryl diester phosphodiesterase membrane domain-containing protein [Anaerolineales bacterium]|nr:glycerophosphoryl diester phosphodiesterase membrane domain-containing protein [Anaerolineales bacterium]
MSSLPLLRPLSIGEILDRAFRIYRSHFVLLISIPLVALIPMMVLQVMSQLILGTSQLVELLQNGFVQILVSGALIVAISQAYLTDHPTLSQAYRAASQRYGAAWGASALMGLAIILPTAALSCAVITLGQGEGFWLILLLVLPYAIFLSTRWTLMLPSVLLERLGAQAGLGRSWTLTKGFFWRVFGTSFLAGMLVLLVATLPQIAVAYSLELIQFNFHISSIVEIVLAQLGLILTLPLSLGVSVVLYYDLRVRKEAFDLEWQMQQTSPTEPDTTQ